MVDFQVLLREIPQVDELLRDERLKSLCETVPRSIVTEEVRIATALVRSSILENKTYEFSGESIKDSIIREVLNSTSSKYQPHLKKIINATGVVLHTNLGRSILCKSAIEAIDCVAASYSNLEFDIEQNARGSRHTHIEKIIADITGAESAMVVNNNAAATMLVLSSLATGKEVIASRGELIEIGGSFRIPEIMALSGAKLREVGTTNKTKLSDYENAINKESTGALIKVHTSNYKVIGFTEDVELKEMVELAHKNGLPAVYDMGSGLFVNLHDYGIDEPTVSEVMKTGVDVIFFSGDKLLGGPQAGIILGKKEYIERMKENQLARVVRVDKLTIASLCASLSEYYDIEKAKQNLPVLKMLTYNTEELKQKADQLKKEIDDSVQFFNTEVVATDNKVGGGSAPSSVLQGFAVTLYHANFDAEKIETLLRHYQIPIISRISHNKVYLDVRTLQTGDTEEIVSALNNARKILTMEKAINGE